MPELSDGAGSTAVAPARGFAGGRGSPSAEVAAAPTPGSRGAPVERLLIHTGELRVAVASPEEAGSRAQAIARELGGHVQSLAGTAAVLRVPAPRFFEAAERVARLGRLLDRKITAQDVTEDVVDLRLRLANALALRKRLEDLLARADKIEDVLKIEAELTRVRTDVERLEGQLKVLETQVALATLTVHFVASSAVPRAARLPFAWLSELGAEGLVGAGGAR